MSRVAGVAGAVRPSCGAGVTGAVHPPRLVGDFRLFDEISTPGGRVSSHANGKVFLIHAAGETATLSLLGLPGVGQRGE